MLSLTLLGPLAVTRDGEPVDGFRSQTEIALLAYLAHTGQVQTRETMADLLWDASSTAQSLSNLRTVLSRLRKRVGDELVVTRKTVALRVEGGPLADSLRLQQNLRAIRAPGTVAEASQLAATLSTYGGDFLADFYLPGAPRFNDWVNGEQERLRRGVLGALEQLVTLALETSNPPLGIAAAEKWLGIDELDETAHAHLIHLLALNGQGIAALAHYDRLVRLLRDELGVDPEPETAALIVRVGRGDIVVVTPDRSTPRPVLAHNLPRELTPFIGRTAERAVLVARLLDRAYPLVTVIGEGGMGKTRLALAAARYLIADGAPLKSIFADGVWFVSLAGIDGQGAPREALAVAIGSALGLSFHGDRSPSDQLLMLIPAYSCLLVLDNFEHLLETDAPDLVVDLLRAGAGIDLLVTSRVPLDLSSEFVVRLGGLPIPEAGAMQPAGNALRGEAEAFDCVRLFTDRASRTGQPFELGDCVDDVVTICRSVAGAPLGIELAAARVGHMSCADIAASIASNLDFLATRQRDVPLRHRSMRAAFEYSWSLLNPGAQRTLAGASVFRGGFDEPAAAAILGVGAGELSQLVDHSLLERDAQERYVMHELLREFAADKRRVRDTLDEQSGGADIVACHGHYYLALVGGLAEGSADSEALLVLAAADLDNVRRAWRWAVGGPHPSALATAWQGLWRFYMRRSLFQEGVEAFFAAQAALEDVGRTTAEHGSITMRLQVARASLLNVLNRYAEAIILAEAVLTYAEVESDAVLRAYAHLLWGTALFRQGHFVAAREHLERGLAESHDTDLGGLEAELRRRLGTTLIEQAQIGRAREELERALTLYRGATNLVGEANLLGDLGWMEQRAHHPDVAHDYHTAALAIQRELDNRHGMTLALINLAGVCGMQRRFEQEIDHLRDARGNLERIDDRYHRSLVNHALGLAWSRVGAYDQAQPYYEQSIAIDLAVGDEAGLAWSHNNLGLLYNHLGDYDTALALHQEALATSQRLRVATTEGLAWSRIAQDLCALGRLDDSIAAFRSAIAIQIEHSQQVWLIESQAGLAHAYADAGRGDEALEQVEELLPQLGDMTKQGAREPFRVYWNCYCVLQGAGDERAAAVLADARRELQRQANDIRDAALRDSYLHNIPSNRCILAV
jgi:DNA-binding SARP family transcriptional activator/predicted ATPase/Tfp pilus assembly protein PilF